MSITIINQTKIPYNYPVLLDDQEVGGIKANQTLTIPTSKGEHQLLFKYSKVPALSVQDGDVLVLTGRMPFPILNHWGFNIIYFVLLLLVNSLLQTQLKFFIIPLLLLAPALPYLLYPHFIVTKRR